MGVAPNVTTWFYSMASTDFWGDLIRWTYELGNETNVPWVHSVSYGEQGNYPPDGYQDRIDTEIQKLGVRGVSIIFASGDSGAGCQPRQTDAKGCDCTFNPSFPATCPHLTSVGATMFLHGNSGEEGAVEAFKSGGGFSVDFDLPEYQRDAVNAYLNSGVSLPEPCSYNASGRATPDVSALGDVHFQVIEHGTDIPVGGTSASSPSFAAIITLINDLRLNAGKPTMGWLNPWIYQTAASNPEAFFDVTVGDNEIADCCASGKQGGFECSKGWDPVTGVGSPNFEVLSKVAMSLI
jgi:tripeptidyl-peptidase-1